MNGREGGQVDHHPGRHLGLAQSAVPLAAGGDLDAVPAGEVDQADDVVDRARLQHGRGPAVDGVAEVFGGGAQGGVVGEELAVETGEAVRRLRAPGGEIRRRRPALQVDVEAGDRHRRQRAAQEIAA